ncbi:hypothetical protein [Microbacterium sp. NPDC056052]|uniref:hypothetical protein n=1 Tax=Microbacterium sp. NPDC056052 TaxID=3345695 RepID=UPI0035D93178
MTTQPEDDELDRLQRRVFSAGGNASKADTDQLFRLLNADKNLDSSSMGDSRGEEDRAGEFRDPHMIQDSADSQTSAPSPNAVSRRRSARAYTRAVVGGVLAVVVSFIGGYISHAILATQAQSISAQPATHADFREGSLHYFGEIQGANVWSGERADDGKLCLIAEIVRPESLMATNCGIDGGPPTVIVSGLTTDTARKFTLIVGEHAIPNLIFDSLSKEEVLHG